jgi:hypothetical protein
VANPIFGEGTAISINDGEAAAFVDVEDASAITPPQETVVVVERNRLSATTLVERAFSTRRDPGQASFQYEVGFDKFDRINDLVNADQSFRITYTDGTRIAFTGRILSNVPEGVQGSAITMATATIQLTSLITLTDSTP